ncbi:MAG: hypothetical protein FJ029_11150 [Actinobacteria bacterium]|nr:hypothetical protein [Actinomycetota bacterium]
MNAPVAGRARGFGFAGFLILIGLMALLANLDQLPDGYWDALWPVLLIALGADVLISRVHPWLGSLAGLLVITAGLVAAGFIAVYGVGLGPLRTERVRVEIGPATTARLELTVAGGDLTLRSGAGPGALVEGTLKTRAGEDALQSTVRDVAGERQVALSSDPGRRVGFGFGRSFAEEWVLALARDVPADVTVRGGAAGMQLDLRDTQVRSIQVSTGAASAQVWMPAAAGLTQATFEMGAASLVIEIPAGVGARIATQTGVSSVTVDEGRFPKVRDGEHRSTGYETAANKVDITKKAGASSIRVR